MYLVESKSGAIGCMLVALVFLGTWPAILAHLERRGRLPQHTYLDYSLTNFLTAVVIALTLGQIGHATPNVPNFFTQLSQLQSNWGCVLIAMGGGIFLGLGNLATQYAWPFVGLSVTEVITSSLAVVLGTTMNYFLDDKMNKAEILFPGVGCFLVAVCLGSAVHSSNAADNAAKLQHHLSADINNHKDQYYKADSLKDMERGSGEEGKARTGSAQHLIELENERAIKVVVDRLFVVCFGEEYLVRFEHNFLRWCVLCSVLAGIQLSNQRSVARDETGRSKPCRLHGLLLLLTLILHSCNGHKHHLSIPPCTKLAEILHNVVPQRLGRQRMRAFGGLALWARQWPAVRGRPSCWICSGRLRPGSPTCEHVLGRGIVWRVLEIVASDLWFASEHVVYVRCGCCGSYCILRASKEVVYPVDAANSDF